MLGQRIQRNHLSVKKQHSPQRGKYETKSSVCCVQAEFFLRSNCGRGPVSLCSHPSGERIGFWLVESARSNQRVENTLQYYIEFAT